MNLYFFVLVYNGTVEYDEDGCFYDPELKASLDYFRYKQVE